MAHLESKPPVKETLPVGQALVWASFAVPLLTLKNKVTHPLRLHTPHG